MTEPETTPPLRPRIGHLRYLIVFMLFIASSVNYADRTALSAAKPGLTHELAIDLKSFTTITLVWGIAYVLAQIPSGRLLDRFGSKIVYGLSILAWSVLILLHGFVGLLPGAHAITLALIALSFLVGIAEAPAFPGNGRIVAQWFPTRERGTASAIFNSSQYFATVIFAPIMVWVASVLGWPWIFWVMGGFGILLTVFWFLIVHSPRQHPWLTKTELDHIAAGGALVDISHGNKSKAKSGWFYARQLLANRMLVGVYIGQFCITTLTYFFVQWIIPYLMDDRHMSILKAGFVAALPALFGFVGGVLGGITSDFLLKRGFSLTAARKTPIIFGMLMASTVVLCNYVKADWIVVAILCLSFFGKGIGALGWTVVADTSPKETLGLCGGIFNMFGNSAQIALAAFVGSFVSGTGSFNFALLYVTANALVAIFCYAFIVGPIKRLELKDPKE